MKNKMKGSSCMNTTTIKKLYPKDRVNKIKKMYQQALVNGGPYLKYLRLCKVNDYLKLLKHTEQKLRNNKPQGVQLGLMYSNLMDTITNNYYPFWADHSGANTADDVSWFTYPTKLMTGNRILQQININISNKNKFLRTVKKHEDAIKSGKLYYSPYEHMFDQWIKKSIYEFKNKQQRDLGNNLMSMKLYKVSCPKFNELTITNIQEANYKDVLTRIQQVIKKHTNKDYQNKIKHTLNILNNLTSLTTDCTIAMQGHAYLNEPYVHDKTDYQCNAWDKDIVKSFKNESRIFKQIKPYRNSNHYINAVKTIHHIEQKSIKTNKYTKKMGWVVKKANMPIGKYEYSITNQMMKKLVQA